MAVNSAPRFVFNETDQLLRVNDLHCFQGLPCLFISFSTLGVKFQFTTPTKYEINPLSQVFGELYSSGN